MNTKKCWNCNRDLSTTNFHKNSARKDGLDTQCKECRSKYNKKWRKNNETKIRQKSHERYIKMISRENIEIPKEKFCSSCNRIKPSSEFYTDKRTKNGLRAECKKCSRWKYILKQYNLMADEWRAIYKEQNGKCPICNSSLDDKDWHTDHDHKTGKIRGILCPRCNKGIGHFCDNPSYLRGAARYLDKFL